MKEIKQQIANILYISKITNVSNKKFRILISVLLSNFSVLADILVIVVFSSLITNEITTENFVVEFFVVNKYLLPIVVVVRFLSIYIEKMNLQSLQLSVRENLRVHLLKEVYNKGNYSLSDATFYINELTTHVSYFYGALTLFISAVIQLLVYGSFLIYSSLNIVTIFLFGGVVLFFPTRYFLRLSRKYIHISYENSIEIAKDIQRVVDNLFLIKILRTNKMEIKNFSKVANSFTKAQLNNYKYGTINSIFPNFLVVFAFAILIVFFDLLEYLTLEFIGVTLRFVQTLGIFNTSLNSIVNSHVHLDKLNSLEKNKRKSNPIQINNNLKNDVAISLKDVSFKYYGSEQKLFNKISIDILKEKHTILTGSNGSGKSTLLGLFSGVLEPDEGEVTCFSKHISYVGANPLIVPGTLRENLVYGNANIVEDKTMETELNNFDLDIDLNNTVTNLSLSSGQMQKIAFIRALLHKSEILFLDESTSNLDEQTKKLITTIINRKKLTILNSTHNPEDFDYDEHIKITINNDKRIINLVTS